MSYVSRLAVNHDFDPADNFPSWRRLNVMTHIYYSYLLARQHAHHPNSNLVKVEEVANVVFPLTPPTSPRHDLRPIYFRGEAATGKSFEACLLCMSHVSYL